MNRLQASFSNRVPEDGYERDAEKMAEKPLCFSAIPIIKRKQEGKNYCFINFRLVCEPAPCNKIMYMPARRPFTR